MRVVGKVGSNGKAFVVSLSKIPNVATQKAALFLADHCTEVLRFLPKEGKIYIYSKLIDAELARFTAQGIELLPQAGKIEQVLFETTEEITDVNPGELANEINGVKYYNPMMIYPATHYTMGGIWVDYNLMTTIPGCYAIGEANFSDHGANRLGASALMQGLADGYFVLPYTIGDYLAADIRTGKIPTDTPEFDEAERIVKERLAYFINNKGTHSVDYFHKKLGKVMWDKVGMARNAEGLKEAIKEIREIREDFWKNVKVPGELTGMNVELEKAGRVADFLELGELFAKDALERNESCGGHFREEYQTPDGEALRDDVNYAYVAAWQYTGNPKEVVNTYNPSEEIMHKEPLVFKDIELKQRSYK